MDEQALIAASRDGHMPSMEVLADLYETRDLRVLACVLRLGARGYVLPLLDARIQMRIQVAGAHQPHVYEADAPVIPERTVRVALKELREANEEARRRALVTVFCIACGKLHTGERVTMAKFRKCCDMSTAERKFCRGCGTVMTREAYFAAGPSSRVGGNAKGWATYAKCGPCGTIWRKPVP